MELENQPTNCNDPPPVALFDASHGQLNWAQTGFPSRELHTNFAGLTESLCRLGFLCRSTKGEPLVSHLAHSRLLIIPSPTGRYDPRRERWRRERRSLFTDQEVQAVLRFLHQGGRLLAFAYRFGDSFTQTNLNALCRPLDCQLNDDAVLDLCTLRQTHPLQLHFDTTFDCLPPVWARHGVNSVRWRPSATFTLQAGTPTWPLALSAGGCCLSFDRTRHRVHCEALPVAVVGQRGAGRFALFGGPHLFESNALGLLPEADNRRFLHNVLHWLLKDTSAPSVPMSLGGALSLPSLHPELTCLEGRAERARAVAWLERLLRQTGVWKALSRAKWSP